MGENAICTKQTNEDGGENRKGKIHLKGTFQLCLYFGDFCRGGERIGILYINKKTNEWVLIPKGQALKVLIRRGRAQKDRVKGGPK